MKFQWDAEKSKANKRKHGIDFQEAQHLWLDDELVEIQAPHPLEKRKIVIGRFGAKLWTAIYTMRSNEIRIISVRRAREKEVKLYEKEEAVKKR